MESEDRGLGTENRPVGALGAEDRSVGGLLSDLANGLATLVRQELRLAQAVGSEKFSNGVIGVAAAVYLIIAVLAVQIATRTELFALAESLGGVESLIEVPQAMTHQSVEDSAAAVPADLVRLSCGVEAADDLVEDLRAAIG